MRRMNARAPRIAGLLALALGAVALLALAGVAAAKDHHGNDHGHGRHHHHHHQFPLQEAGTISSFDATTGKLTIALPDEESVIGMVTEDTRIKCEAGEEEGEDRRDHGSEGSEPGDDDGEGAEPGDDNGSDSSGPGPSRESGAPAAGEPEPGEESCTVASLVPGAVVGQAELRLEGGAAVFTEIDLGLDS